MTGKIGKGGKPLAARRARMSRWGWGWGRVRRGRRGGGVPGGRSRGDSTRWRGDGNHQMTRWWFETAFLRRRRDGDLWLIISQVASTSTIYRKKFTSASWLRLKRASSSSLIESGWAILTERSTGASCAGVSQRRGGGGGGCALLLMSGGGCCCCWWWEKRRKRKDLGMVVGGCGGRIAVDGDSSHWLQQQNDWSPFLGGCAFYLVVVVFTLHIHRLEFFSLLLFSLSFGLCHTAPKIETCSSSTSSSSSACSFSPTTTEAGISPINL